MKAKLKNLDEKSLKRMNTMHLTSLLIECSKESKEFKTIWNILQRRRAMVQNFSKKALEQFSREYKLKLEKSKICFGHKDEAYFTEEQALFGYKPPKYEELSEMEQRLYDYYDEVDYPEDYFNPKTKEDGI
jgi:hypothetical protein